MNELSRRELLKIAPAAILVPLGYEEDGRDFSTLTPTNKPKNEDVTQGLLSRKIRKFVGGPLEKCEDGGCLQSLPKYRVFSMVAPDGVVHAVYERRSVRREGEEEIAEYHFQGWFKD